jgi:hypothetical protein
MTRAQTSAVLACLTLFSLLFGLSSCNLREDILLPPNLDPKDYVIGNTIRVYSDYLVKSENDDSYLYIHRESISDSLLWYGDQVSLQKVDALLSRDSLAFAEGSLAVTDTYKVSILRAGTEVVLDSVPAFATLYTQLTAAAEYLDIHQLSLRHQLQAEPVEVYPYGLMRAFFDLTGSGEVSLVNFNNGSKISIPAGNQDLEALLVTSEDYLQAWIPGQFRSDMGSSELEIRTGLQNSQIQAVQNVFPGFALQSKVLMLSTANNASSNAVPIIHYRLPASKSFGTQWIKLNNGSLSSWESGDETWKITGATLISFINGAGSYFLAEPLATQNSLEIPLNGAFTQLYLPGMWLDLTTAVLPNTSMYLSGSQTGLLNLPENYYDGDPFTVQGDYQIYQINFRQGRTPLETLPDDKYLEFGFKTSLPLRANTRLSRIYSTSSVDHLDYKVYGSEYDANHYTLSNGYVYSGINSSGTYVYASISENSQTLTIPCLKEELELQTSRTYLSWSDPSLPCSSISLSYNAPITEAHPWLNGSPYQYSGNSLLKLSATNGSRNTDELPEDFFLSQQISRSLESVINFSPRPDYPRFYRYRASESFAHNTFIYSGGRLQISPAVAGYLIAAGNLTPPQSGNLALFNRMIFDDYDWELYLDSRTPMRIGSILQYSVQNSFADPYQVFSGQYQLAPFSSVYSFDVPDNPAFFDLYQPYVRLRQSGRNRNLLFSELGTEYYRVYSYEQATQADGWHFSLSDGHIAFLLAHPGRYCAVTDTNEHTTVDVVASTVRDLHASLYQAQFVLPQEYIGLNIPLGARFTLLKLGEIPPGITASSAYQIQIRGPQLNLIFPNFFNFPEQDRYPYIYLPIPDYIPGLIPNLFFRDHLGTTRDSPL